MNKKYLMIGIALFVILVLIILLLKSSFSGGSVTKAPKANDPAVESRVDWLQKQMSVNVFTTREDPEGQVLEDKQAVHVSFMSFFALSLNGGEKVKEFTIDVVKFAQGVGEQVVYQTPHTQVSSMRSYLYTTDTNNRERAKDIAGSGRTIRLQPDATATTTVQYFDQIPAIGGIPLFSLFTKNIGTVSEQAILNSNKVYESGKVLTYLGTKAEDLNGEIILDFHITFEDGKKYDKRMKGTIDGTKILGDPPYIIDFEAVQ